MAFGRESRPGMGQPAEWKIPEKKPFNPAMMEQTLRDLPKETAETYNELPPPPVGDDDLPAFLGTPIEAEQQPKSTLAPDITDLEIDSAVSNLGESKPEIKFPNPSPEMFAETLPNPRQERASDYKIVSPPVDTQPEEKIQMRNEKIIIDGKEYNVPPVLDAAAEAVLQNPDLMDFEKVSSNADELARFFPGLDAPAREQISSMFHVRSKLLDVQLQMATTPEMKENLVKWNKKNLVEAIKEEQARTADRQKKRAA